jgi:protein involved in temperature-dependent protein secretion
MGQRMLVTDAGEYPLLEVRELLIGADVAAT